MEDGPPVNRRLRDGKVSIRYQVKSAFDRVRTVSAEVRSDLRPVVFWVPQCAAKVSYDGDRSVQTTRLLIRLEQGIGTPGTSINGSSGWYSPASNTPTVTLGSSLRLMLMVGQIRRKGEMGGEKDSDGRVGEL